MFSFLDEYKKLEKPILLVIFAEFFLQLVNVTFLNIQPFFLESLHYTQTDIAGFVKWRFLGVFFLGVVLGLLLKGKKVKNYFIASCICVPLFALAIIYAADHQMEWLVVVCQLLWGASFTLMQIPVIPFILRNTKTENHTAGISLSYATWSMAGIVSGLVIAFLDVINPQLFNARMCLLILTYLSFGGLICLAFVKLDEKVLDRKRDVNKKTYDWKIIFKALIPTFIIAIGAGLTIPFVSMFFSSVHNLSKGGFSMVSAVASVLVLLSALYVPHIKKHIGFSIAIPTTQSLAIVALICLATTQFYNQLSIAVYIAIGCYLLRQPLMNVAGPMTTELVMKYVGPTNQEIVSVFTSAIWSGSWFFSGWLTQIMLHNKISYGYIFLITAAIYSVGVFWYYLLILDYNKNKVSEKI